MYKSLLAIFLLLTPGFVLHAEPEELFLTENKGQWHSAVAYRADIPTGNLYLDSAGFTYQLFDGEMLAALHGDRSDVGFEDVRMHVVKTRFVGANPMGEFERSDPSQHYSNYFIGNDSARWASDVRSFEWVKRKDLYNGVDLKVYRSNGVLKYDLIAQSGAAIEDIAIEYEGAESLELIDGQLHVRTSLADFIEQPPFVYQLIDGKISKVECNYILDGNTLRFEFPNGFNSNFELVIDPEISFSSYVGSSFSSFGYTATYDDDGNLYAGAISFGSGYPTSAGAFDTSHNGGTIDVAVSKFSSDGSQLLFSTFLGGNGNESPHSLVVSETNELYILGSTGSQDFPTTAGVLQPTFAGGPSLTFNIGYGFPHTSGTDIFVSRLNAAGTNLIASTFVGGSGNDGINSDPELEYNYGDAFRGEIILDDDNNVYVASVTSSTDFPTTPGAFQPGYAGGTTDGCVFKLNPALSALQWSSYLGGAYGDAAFSIQLNELGIAYVAGATGSTNLNTSDDAMLQNYQGNVDGMLARISTTGQNLLGLTYIGTNAYDEAFFVQIDTEGDVFVVGQTEGSFDVSDDVYSNPNSGQFIQKLDPGLTTSLLATTLGNGNGGPNISISAFLVSNCNQIYVSGWGGSTNSGAGGVSTSTTNNLPVTDDAFQSTTDGSDFYLMVLSPDAEELVFATFFGGSSSNEHVDGGTSRFDKRGTVYQAVCAGCGGYDDFPTQPGVWSETNNSGMANGQCNLGVFKFDLATINAQIGIDGPNEVCAGSTVNFINSTTVANTFDWDFGGQGTSDESSPDFVFDTPGDYTITMTASHEDDCISSDTASIEIVVLPPPEIDVSSAPQICSGDSVQLFVDGADSYQWYPAAQVDDPTSDSPWVWADETTTFTVVSTSSCGEVDDTVIVEVLEEDYGAGDDVEVCPGQSVGLSAFGGVSYEWSPTTGLNNPNISNPQASPDSDINYQVEITSPNGCVYNESVSVIVLSGAPEVATSDVVSICDGGSAYIYAAGGDEYQWAPVPGLSNYNVNNPIASPESSTWYPVEVINQCGSTFDSVYVHVGNVNAQVSEPDTICPNEPLTLNASGGVSYSWFPVSFIDDPQSSSVTVYPPSTREYSVAVFDEHGCFDVASVVVPVHQPPYVQTGPDVVVDYYDYVPVDAVSNGDLFWESDDLWLNCNDCPNPEAHATETGVVYVTATDENGCTATDSMLIEVTGAIYVPNAFSPNGDGVNDIFKAVGTEIEEFHMRVFDRWGELIFESFDIDDGWNGGVDRHYVENEVYVWKIRAKEHTGHAFDLEGHVTVIR